MSEDLHKNLECPVCLQYFTKPIKQCIVGHSFCSECVDPKNIKSCPVCRKAMSNTRSIVLEQLLDSLSLTCPNKDRGCGYLLPKEKMIDHIIECKHRLFKCEGKLFCKWNCPWQGHDILDHFKTSHTDHPPIQFNGTETIRYDTTQQKTIKLITAHYQLFWFKHKIDVNKQNVYWTIQFIGPSVNAQYYYYEFEIYKQDDDTKRFKITDYCKNDIENTEDIFDAEQCVVISLKMLKNYVDANGTYTIRYRLMKKKKPDEPKSPTAVTTKNPIAPKAVPVKSTGAINKSKEVIEKSSGKTKRESQNRPRENDTITWLPYINYINYNKNPQRIRKN